MGQISHSEDFTVHFKATLKKWDNSRDRRTENRDVLAKAGQVATLVCNDNFVCIFSVKQKLLKQKI